MFACVLNCLRAFLVEHWGFDSKGADKIFAPWLHVNPASSRLEVRSFGVFVISDEHAGAGLLVCTAACLLHRWSSLVITPVKSAIVSPEGNWEINGSGTWKLIISLYRNSYEWL